MIKIKVANVLLSNAWGDITPEALNRGIGGREGAMIYLSREWAKSGHEVTNFVPIKKSQRIYENGYHEYIPINTTKAVLSNFPYDVAIAWECASLFEEEGIREMVPLKICEMQVAHFAEADRDAADKYCDYVAALSDWHAEFLIHSGLELPRERVLTLPNGVDLNKYPKDQFEQKRQRKIGKDPKFVYSSSPDRGLWYLLQMWPDIRKKFPKASLIICYGAMNWVNHIKWSHGRIAEMAVGIEELIRQPGVKDLGKIGQDQLAQLQMEADAWIYPFDPMSPTETGCISAIENLAAGNPIITTNADCMEDEFAKTGTIIKLPFEKDRFVEETIDVLIDQDYIEYQRDVGRKFAEKRDWQVISKQWEQIFTNQN